MLAAVFDRFGEPGDVLRIEERPLPTPGVGEVRVRMLASPVNPSDLMTIRGVYGIRPALPSVPGYEGVGIVDAARAGLFGNYLMGKRVAVLKSVTGNWQGFAIASAKSVIPLPQSLTNGQAAMFFVNPATAVILTRKLLAVPRNAWLLQSAAASSVGKMVIRLGRRYGFKTMNLVRSSERTAELQALGADVVIPFDPARDSTESLMSAVLKHTGSEGVRYAIDPVGGATASAMAGCLGKDGRLIVYGTLSSEPLNFSSRVLMTSGSRVEGFWLTHYMGKQGLLAKLGLIRELSTGIQSGMLTADVAATFPLSDVVAAVEAAEQPGRAGKVLLSIGE
ncbi:MAG: zinc-dependent alcohol dehydrogenase family protein [Planctomycetaceae bacterium]|nr:zinc-dependent alcohol dehydrogenase family protein [Planctomycetaceae bacterium]